MQNEKKKLIFALYYIYFWSREKGEKSGEMAERSKAFDLSATCHW